MRLIFRLFFIAVLLVPIASFSQNNWNHYDINDGMLDNELTDIYIENEQKIWLASRLGLCAFNSVSKTFGSFYTISNGTLISQNVKKIEYANNRLWFSTSNGVSSINNGTLTNYNLTNGLIDKDVRDLAVDTNGQLWIATPSGVAYFNDTTFIHDTTVSAYHIAIDDSNRIFIIDRSFNILFNNNGPFLTHRVYDGSSWTQPAVSGISNSLVAMYNIEFKKSEEGIFILNRDHDGGYYKLTYPFHLDSVPSYWPDYVSNSGQKFRTKDLAFTSNGRRWIIGSHEFGLFSTNDSILSPHFLSPQYDHYSPISGLIERIEANDSLVIVGSTNGIYIGSSNAKAPESGEVLDINNIRTSVNNYGPLFNDYISSQADFEMPKNTNQFGIYSANVFVSSKRVGNPLFKSNLISPFNLNHALGPVSNTAGIEGNWLLKLSKQEINHHLAQFSQRGYTPIDAIRNWPVFGDTTLGLSSGIATFIDANGDGCYDPLAGDYPSIKGDQAIYWVNHIDKFEYHGVLYGYHDSLNTDINQAIFMDYTIINRDTVNYDSVKVGIYIDFDLGNFADDFIGCDSLENIFFVYNGDGFDENRAGRNGYGLNTPALGVKFLSDSMDGFLYYLNGNLSNGEPQNDAHVFNYLNSIWKDGIPVTYGGSGRSSTAGTSTKYMYTGNPATLTGWTELTPGAGLPSNAPGDRRGLAHIPFFKLKPNQRKTISISIGYGQNSGNSQIGGNISEMIRILNHAKQVWDTTTYQSNTVSTNDSCVQLVTNLNNIELEKNEKLFNLFPNPTSSHFTIQFNKRLNHSQSIVIYNSNGHLIRQLRTDFSTINVETMNMSSGLYFVRIGSTIKKLMLLK